MRGAALLVTLMVCVACMTFSGPSWGHPVPRPLPRDWTRGALCIHQYEGSWLDGGSPYYGGMQMDYNFMRAYGATPLKRKGTAENWPPHQQLYVAYMGWRHRGWYPWPHTARLCGLL